MNLYIYNPDGKDQWARWQFAGSGVERDCERQASQLEAKGERVHIGFDRPTEVDTLRLMGEVVTADEVAAMSDAEYAEYRKRRADKVRDQFEVVTMPSTPRRYETRAERKAA